MFRLLSSANRRTNGPTRRQQGDLRHTTLRPSLCLRQSRSPNLRVSNRTCGKSKVSLSLSLSLSLHRNDCVKSPSGAPRTGAERGRLPSCWAAAGCASSCRLAEKAAGVFRLYGFAVGTDDKLWDPIVAFRDGKATREQAAAPDCRQLYGIGAAFFQEGAAEWGEEADKHGPVFKSPPAPSSGRSFSRARFGKCL